MKIGICGIGAFGFAILKHLDKHIDYSNHELLAHEPNKEVHDYLNKNKFHPRFHEHVKISDKILFTNDIKEFAKECDIIILSISSTYIPKIIESIKEDLKNEVILLNVAKALDPKTGKTQSEIISEAIPNNNYSYAILAGGTIASDLFSHEPLGIEIASKDEKTLKRLKDIFSSKTLNVYTSNDVKGIEYASAFKNLISIFAGIIHGMNFCYGSETHLISRASKEVKELILTNFKDVQEKTFSMENQAWGNDLWMSCTGKTRNREYGILIGKGLSPELAAQVMEKQGKTIEGNNTIQIVNELIKNNKNKYPILDSLYKIVVLNENPRITFEKYMEVGDN